MEKNTAKRQKRNYKILLDLLSARNLTFPKKTLLTINFNQNRVIIVKEIEDIIAKVKKLKKDDNIEIEQFGDDGFIDYSKYLKININILYPNKTKQKLARII